MLPVEYQVLVEHALHLRGDLGHDLAAGTFAGVGDLGTEHHGIQHLYHGGGAVDIHIRGAVDGTQAGGGGKNMGGGILTAQHHPLGEHRKTGQRRGAIGAGDGIGQNAIEEGHFHAITVAVKGYRLHLNAGIEQVCAAYPGGSGAVVSMKPMGFLIDDGNGCRILRVTEDTFDNLIERAGEIMRDIMAKD